MFECAIYDHLLATVDPVPRPVVYATPLDAHLDEDRRNYCAAGHINNPWAASGHYGRELGLMLGGHKKCAIIDWPDEIEIWQPHIDSGRFIARPRTDSEVWHVADADREDLIEVLCGSDMGAKGLALGYQVVDIVFFLKRMAAFQAGGPLPVYLDAHAGKE